MGDKPGEPPASIPTVKGRRGGEALARKLETPTDEPGAKTGEPAAAGAARYALKREIARGGMGRVFEATDTVLGRTVAVKEALSLDPEMLRRFSRETRITARLEHPSIVPVHDAGSSPTGQPFYVMRKIGGRPLDELVARADKLSQRLALVPHVVAAAQAIAHAHARGIVHRDIKPANILAGDLGETIVIDWGLAKAIGEPDEPHTPVARVIDSDRSIKTRADLVFGTPGFMAPEQLRGKPADERCDVYALGATLYHLLARVPPHHARSPEDMMEAAAFGPPPPLGDLVDGVPPELATIVDKALAHEPSKRYRNAGALAEDLQRFLTGQLVASHAYTPRERIARFIKKHRTSVGIAGAALVVVLVIAAALVQEIRDERDRADEQARAALHEKRIAEQQREDVFQTSRELVLTNARYQAASAPTRAVAMVKQLADTNEWRAARDVGAAASVHGVAFSLPASPRTLTLELSHDGQRALAAGDDGLVRIYDLARREIRVVADTKGAVMARFGDGERKVVLFQGNRMSVVDLARNEKHDVTAPTAIAQLEVSGPIAYWVDPAFAVWSLDLAGGEPTKLVLGEPVTALAPSPDDRWIALAGTQHLLLVDRARRALPPEIIAQGQTKTMTWSANSDHLVALIEDEVVDVDVVPAPQIRRRITVGNRFSAMYSGGRIFSAGPTGVGVVEPQGTKLRAEGPEHTLGVHEGPDRLVIAPRPQGEIVVLGDHGDHTLRGPAPIDRVATSAHGPWIVAATEHQLLVWNTDALVPRVISKRSPSSAQFVTGDHVIVTYFDQPAEWIDLRKHATVQLGVMNAVETIAPAPGGEEAIVIDSARRAWRVVGLARPQELAGEISAAVFIDDRRLVLAGAGAVRLEDQENGTKLALYAHQAAATTLAATAEDGGWIAAAFEDGRLWRKQLASHAATELELGKVTGALPLVLAGDGTAVFAVRGELRTWRPDGRVEVLGTPSCGVTALALVDRERVLAVGEHGAMVVDIAGGSALPPPVPLLGAQAALARTGGLVAAATATGGVEVIDPLVTWAWPLATRGEGEPPFARVDIAPDGSRVLAATATEVFVWTLDLPGDAEATKAWLGRMSNATVDNPSGPLGWQKP